MVKTNHAKKIALAERRAKVAKMLGEGMNQLEIARQLLAEGTWGFTTLPSAQVGVVNDVKVIKEDWKRSAHQDFDELKGRQYEKLEWMFNECRSAWERSKQSSHSATVNQYKSPKNAGRPLASAGDDDELQTDRVVSTVRKDNRDGDVSFMVQMRGIVEQQCELMGLKAKPGEVGTAPPLVSFRIHSHDGGVRDSGTSPGPERNGSSPAVNGDSQSA